VIRRSDAEYNRIGRWSSGVVSQSPVGGLRMEQARIAERSARVILATTKLVASISIILLPCYSAQSQYNDPHELTSRGIISEDARKTYRQVVEPCYHGVPGKSVHGPEVLDCLRLQVRREGETLDAVYRARISYLASSPDQASRLRTAQKAWLQFRDENCEFIRSVAPRRSADESFYDCVLKTTIDRRVELRRSVGD
jgi:uncharacterized protein YecT (DUF1311 family)